jgi:integrase/recombinase XerD
MLREELMIKILTGASEFLSEDQINSLRMVLDEQLCNYNITQSETALVPINNMQDKIIIYLASKKIDGLSMSTLNSYKRQLLRFSNNIPKNMEDITPADIRMYLYGYTKAGCKNSTLNNIVSILKSFFSWMIDNDYLQKNPMNVIKQIKTDKFIRKALTPIELEMLRKSCKTPREKALCEFFYSTGARLDEVCKLNKSDIDWNNNSVIVFGKGRKERIVFLTPKARVYMWDYFNNRTDTNEALFVSDRQPHDRLERRGIQKIFNALGRRSGISKKVYPHLMRHTHATHMLNNGASISEVQKSLGHTSPATTQVYANLNNEAIQQSHKRHIS